MTGLTKRQREPHTAKPMHGSTEAWWYEDDKGISVYVVGLDGRTASCRITRRVLADWIKRTAL